MDIPTPIRDLLLKLGPSETAFLEWLAPHLNDSHLHKIADADLCLDEAQNFQALKHIQQGRPMPVPLEWIPREVLSLRRWIEPCDPHQSGLHSIPQITDKALICAFCCAVLLQAADSPQTLDLIASEVSTLIQYVAAARCLGRAASESALRSLCWRVLRLPDAPEYSEEFPFFAMAILLLYATLFVPYQDGSDLNLLADWVMEVEAQTREEWGAPGSPLPWLLGLTLFEQRHAVWRRLAQEILFDSAKSFPEPAATKIRGMAKRLYG